jgi:hypothetical protein
MDFLYPKKMRRNRLILLAGYGLVAIAIGIAALLMLYQAYGYGFGKNGVVIQNGWVFVSSHPSGATLYTNGIKYKSQTNSRMVLPAGNYQLKITEAGYRDWQRQIVVAGGDVQHFDYPILFPVKLQTQSFGVLEKAPSFASQSPDKRWWLVKPADGSATLLEYDMKNPAKPALASLTIPNTAYTTGDESKWQVVDWSGDNRHVLLLHSYSVNGTPGHEYIVLDRSDPSASSNVTQILQLPAGDVLSLYNHKYNQYYAFDAASGTLRTLSLDNSLEPEQWEHVLAFQPYGTNRLLYVTSQPPTGKQADGTVSVVLQEGQTVYTLRTMPSGAHYALGLTEYDGVLYVAVGSDKSDGAYVYKNPQHAALTAGADLPSPWRLLRVHDLQSITVSPGGQYIAAESGRQFMIYDAENIRTYQYITKQSLDQPQTGATWMDGHHLQFVSGGKLVVFDYDYQNPQVLQPAMPGFLPVFDGSLKYSYSVAPQGAGATLTSTPLLVPKS